MTKSYLQMIRLSILSSLILPPILGLCNYAVSGEMLRISIIKPVMFVLIAAMVSWGVLRLLRQVEHHIDNLCKEQASYLDSIDIKYVDLAILLSSGMSLFLELAVIRWQSSIFPVFALYKNYSLLACVMGLGLGYSLARRESIPLFFTIPALAVQMLLLTVLKYGVDLSKLKGLMVTPFTERLDMGLIGAKTFSHFSAIYLFLLVIFLITVVAFIPAGQLCGRLMERRNNLRSYGINLMGSILGVVLILAISFLWTPPIIWFCICFVCLLVFQLFNPKALFLGILFSLVSVTILAWPTSIGFEKIYSPYQVLERGPGPRGLSLIRAAGHYYQRIHDLSKSNANRNTDPKLAQIANYYELPYKVFGKKPGHVAIVGAGTGNDVAAALRQGATRVEAIEIDPAIWKLGKLFHPEKPYDDPRVTSVINDARTFLRTTDSSFDMIVYGLLDSHTLLSHASSVRLDSYIYTVEALREAILRLKDGGLLSLSFCVLSAEIGRKIYLMMEEAFGSAPICILSLYDHSVIFFQNKEGNFSIENSVSKEIERLNISDYYSDPKIKADVSTDDWPFFYMPKRVYPKSYLGILALMMVLSTYTVFVFYRQNMVFANPAFFFMGTGFMLIETKAITEMGLVFGNTWHVIVIVIASILLMAFIANCFVQIFRINKPFFPFLLLIISLIVGYTASVKGGFDSTLTGKISTVVILTCPMLFSGIIFSSLLGQSKALTGVMAVNLIGAMLGGVLEYNSMYFGFSFLYIAAIFLYILAMVSFFFIKGIR